MVEPALSSLAASATVGHDKYAYLTAFPSNENGQITAEIRRKRTFDCNSFLEERRFSGMVEDQTRKQGILATVFSSSEPLTGRPE